MKETKFDIGADESRKFEAALEFCIGKIRHQLGRFGNRFPGPATVNGVYPVIGNDYWTSSFWTGQLWLAWEVTGDDEFRAAAEEHYDSYERRLRKRIETGTHDLGFLYSLSCVAGFRLTGSSRARNLALEAADLLLERFLPAAGIFQAWGPLDNPVHEHRGRIIVDCLMNLPLLRWASEETGDPAYADAAARHLRASIDHLIRPDGSTFHTFVFDPADGRPLRGETAQGRSDDSCWARGQAWAIYGLSLAFVSTGDESHLETASQAADYFLDHLPADGICPWDFDPAAAGEERDSSAAAIAAGGLRELARLFRAGSGGGAEQGKAERYRDEALRILASLCSDYTTAGIDGAEGLLLHGVYSKPDGKGVDEGCIWGDYFFLEALVSALRERRSYW